MENFRTISCLVFGWPCYSVSPFSLPFRLAMSRRTQPRPARRTLFAPIERGARAWLTTHCAFWHPALFVDAANSPLAAVDRIVLSLIYRRP